MGQSSKKKKRGGGGRRSKGRTPSKDHNSQGGDGYDVISDEITALCAIFEEDCKVVSESPPQIYIKLRPYSKETGYEDLEVSAFLSVRCLPGYPHKCPKLQIHPEKGLSKTDADNLLSLLHEQANSNAREGRVMIYNLVEVAQEFLSEIVPFGGLSNDSVPCQDTDRSCQLPPKDAVIYSNSRSTGPFVYGFLDLFSGSGESWNWGLEMEDNGGIKTSARSPIVAGPKDGYAIQRKDGYAIQRKDGSKQMPAAKIQDTMKALLVSPAKLDIVDEVCEDEMKTISATDSDGFLTGEPDESDTSEDLKEVSIKELTEKADIDNSDSEFSEFAFPVSLASTHSPPTMEKDLILAHLLRLACAPKGQLADALPDITSELLSLGVISEEVRDLATKPSSLFEKTFQRAFGEQLALSRITQFWKTASDMQNTVSVPSSRYLSDFEELHPLGQGGFGHVVLCKNKLDGRQYAMKKIRLKDKSLPVNDRILREVATLSRLQHQHVVRYYQAWFETGPPGGDAGAIGDSMTAASSSFSCMAASSTDLDNKIESTYLYIQMEYCPRTLRQMFESYSHFDKELAWHLFRQIVEGLAHIHGQGIIHRDLTPNNIFFDARNDIKIGDFGLAKFLKLGQLEQDPDPAETAGVSIDGTGQVGTYFYTAPEIEQGWPKIDEKADMYSLGIVFFELWHPFGTAMERHIVLSDLKLKGEPPPSWATEYPDQASLLRHLMSPSPSDRPAATEVLKHSLPPRMENELLENLLRTMHTSEDTSVYDKVVNAIFDEDKDLGRNVTSPIQLTDVDTEIRDQVVELTVEVFRQRCAKHLEVVPLRLLGDCPNPNMNAVKLLTRGGDKIELCHELRLPFVNWVTTNQKLYFKRYEVSYVYRRSIGHSPPNRYLQGDFDIIGGTSGLTEAEIIKTSMDIITSFFNSESCDIHVNHGNLLDAIWSWVGIKAEHRKNVSELLSLMGSLRPHESSERKSKWGVIRRQLRQELNLAEAVVNRLQIVGSRFCGPADQALPRLRGALPAVKSSREALDQLSELFTFLRFWRIEKRVFLDVLMPPTESYHRDMFFQIYLRKENNPSEGTLLAVGGRYDFLIDQMWRSRYKSNNPPGGVGVSIALETIIQNSSVDIKRVKYDTSTTSILVCSRGGGGYLGERMELVAELWEENIKADYVPLPDPSLTEQYEYANEHDIKCLVIITDTGVSKKGSVMVRYLEPKRVKEIERESLVKFLLEAMAVQFKNPSIWN